VIAMIGKAEQAADRIGENAGFERKAALSG
jgi:hypothetical protein